MPNREPCIILQEMAYNVGLYRTHTLSLTKNIKTCLMFKRVKNPHSNIEMSEYPICQRRKLLKSNRNEHRTEYPNSCKSSSFHNREIQQYVS